MEECNQHSGIVSDIKNLKASDAKQWIAIEKLQNRLPTWATVLISTLTFALGVSLTWAGFAVQIARLKNGG